VLVEVDTVELALVELVLEMVMLEVLVVSRMTSFVNDVVCGCALAKNPGNDNTRARKAMVMRMYELISLPKPATTTPI
jgi:hypothetical protein